MSKILMWFVDNVPMGRLAPWVFGLAMGRWPHKVKQMVAGFGPDGKHEKNDNRSKSTRKEKSSADKLGARLVRGSGSSRYAKGDFTSNNPSGGIRSGYSYQQKSGVKGVRITSEIIDQTRKEAVMHNKVPVIEIIVEGHGPWYMVDQETWMRLSGEGAKS